MDARVMIFGGRGYLGQQFRALYPHADCPPVDISDRAAVAAALGRRPDVVINCAGKTGRPNVDWCETHQSETLRANVTGVLVLLEECLARGVYIVHLGSGCIYAGDNGGEGFREDDAPNFAGSFYSRTKAWADQILAQLPGAQPPPADAVRRHRRRAEPDHEAAPLLARADDAELAHPLAGPPAGGVGVDRPPRHRHVQRRQPGRDVAVRGHEALQGDWSIRRTASSRCPRRASARWRRPGAATAC